jgi:CDGSH-type Zn-finger protein
MEQFPDTGKPFPAECHPIAIKVEPGKTYSWCTCGLSEKQPFCDSRHKYIDNMPFRSLKVVFDKEEEVWFCQCKMTSTPPFCDGTHHEVKKTM